MTDENNQSIVFPFKRETLANHCFGIRLEPDTTLVMDYKTTLDTTDSGLIAVRDTCLHLHKGSFQTTCRLKDTEEYPKWSLHLKYRVMNEQDSIQLVILDHKEKRAALWYENKQLRLQLDSTVLIVMENEQFKEGEWSFITLKQTAFDIHLKWDSHCQVVMNTSLFPLSSHCSIQVGDNASTWDLLSLSLSTLLQTLYSFEMVPLSHLSTCSDQSLPFSSHPHQMNNCSWYLSSKPYFTFNSLQQQLNELPFQPVLTTWDHVFHVCTQIVSKIHKLQLSSNTVHLPLPVCD